MKKIKRKTLLYKSEVEYGDYTINHIQGCAHGCKYPCYAMLMAKRFGRIKNYEDWLEPKIVENALQLLDKEIPRLKNKINFVHLSFMTDPFMKGYPEITDLTLKIIQKLNESNIKITLLTKGELPKQLVNTKKYRTFNEYGASLVSLDEKFRTEFEPFSSQYEERINSLYYLHENGLNTWVSIEPYPTPNIVEQDLKKLLEKVSFVNKIVFGRMNYNKQISEFGDYQTFYNEATETVTEFCMKNNIELHIKEKTLKKPNETKMRELEKTRRLFRRVTT
ncbi:MAG: radical SAM protein [bacterium]|nr:radical SAM protein [bacterium]